MCGCGCLCKLPGASEVSEPNLCPPPGLSVCGGAGTSSQTSEALGTLSPFLIIVPHFPGVMLAY